MAAEFSHLVLSCLRQHAGQRGDQVALLDVSDGRGLTWRQVLAQVETLAVDLRRLRPASPSTPLYLLPSHNGLDKLVLWLGAWSAGAAVLTIDTEHLPDDTVTRLLHTAQPHARLSLAPDGALLVSQSAASDASPRARLDDGVVLVNCTSGTTGLPKLVYQSGAAAWHNGALSAHYLDLQPGEHCLEVRALNWYSAQIISLIPFIQRGTCLHLAPRFSLSQLPHWLARHDIRFLASVPSMLRLMLDAQTALPASMQRLSCSSAALSAHVWHAAEQAWNIPVQNLYGSSELGWICGSTAAQRHIGRVGRPAPDVHIDLIDAEGQSVADGGTGTLLVHSPYAATRSRSILGDTLYQAGEALATHDLGRIEPDGALSLVGRADDMIQRGGINIHPAAIEAWIEQLPGVGQAVVFGIPDTVYGEVPGVVYTCTGAPDEQALVRLLDARIPRAWVPVHWWRLDAIPLGGNGKVSRRLLRERFTPAG